MEDKEVFLIKIYLIIQLELHEKFNKNILYYFLIFLTKSKFIIIKLVI